MSARGYLRHVRRYWPRRGSGLPAGQRVLDVFPRFADDPRRPPPEVPADPTLTIRKAGGDECLVPVSELVGSEVALDRTVDFHCVTTWSVRDQTWTGVPVRA